jgi:hypothetical protein
MQEEGAGWALNPLPMAQQEQQQPRQQQQYNHQQV